MSSCEGEKKIENWIDSRVGHLNSQVAEIINNLLEEEDIIIIGSDDFKRDVKKGLATLCIGGGMGIAMCVER